MLRLVKLWIFFSYHLQFQSQDLGIFLIRFLSLIGDNRCYDFFYLFVYYTS